MNKKLFNLSLITLGLLAISSCSNGSKMSKGKSVNSVTFDNYVDNGGVLEKKTVTINKNDSYADMMSKLGYTSFAVKPKKGSFDITPYEEKYSEKEDSTVKNDIYGELSVTNDMIDWNYGYTEIGTHTKKITTTASTKMYDLKISNNYFFNASKDFSRYEEYKSTKETVSAQKNINYKDKKTYYNDSLSGLYGGKIEIATNLKPFRIRSDIEFSDNDTFYFTEECTTDDYSSKIRRIYMTDDNKASFTIMNLQGSFGSITVPTMEQEDKSSQFFNYAYVSNGSMNFIPEVLLDYYDYSFELTDKYIIIINKLKTSFENLNYLMNNHYYNYPEILEENMNKYKGSYEYREVWVDYKNAELITTEDSYGTHMYFHIGYDYYKEDIIKCLNYSYLWGDKKYYPYDKELLESIGAYNKTWEMNYYSERHWETKTINLSQEEIDKTKNDFIEKCKKNNIVDKYNFKPFN